MSENAVQDQNHVPAKLAVLNTDTVQGTNKVRIQLDELNGNAMRVSTVDTISFTMVPIDSEDENYRDCLMFTGSDGATYPWVATADGKVLISM